MRTLKSLLSDPGRLFWTLQIVGWCCYSILGFSAKVGEGAPPIWIFFYLAVGAFRMHPVLVTLAKHA